MGLIKSTKLLRAFLLLLQLCRSSFLSLFLPPLKKQKKAKDSSLSFPPPRPLPPPLTHRYSASSFSPLCSKNALTSSPRPSNRASIHDLSEKQLSSQRLAASLASSAASATAASLEGSEAAYWASMALSSATRASLVLMSCRAAARSAEAAPPSPAAAAAALSSAALAAAASVPLAASCASRRATSELSLAEASEGKDLFFFVGSEGREREREREEKRQG